MTVETLEFLIEELRVQAFQTAADHGLSLDATLEWDLADTLDEVREMLQAEIAAGGDGAALARRVVARLLAVSLEGYRR